MNRYETIYIVNPNLDADSLKEIIDKFSDIVKKLKGSMVKINEWGKRKLAYEIKKFDKGYYVVFDFCGLPGLVSELERNLKLDDRILKYLTVKIDEDAEVDDLLEKEKKLTGADQPEETHDESAKEE